MASNEWLEPVSDEEYSKSCVKADGVDVQHSGRNLAPAIAVCPRIIQGVK